MPGFKSFFGKKHFDVIYKNKQFRATTSSYYNFEMFSDSQWWVEGDLFALKNDLLVMDFFKQQGILERKFNAPGYNFTHVKNHPAWFYKNNVHTKRDTYSNIYVEGGCVSLNKLLARNKLSDQVDVPKNKTLSLKSVLPDNMAIPLEVHKYILSEIKPEYVLLRDSLCYFDSSNSVVAFVAPIKFFD